MAPNKNNNDIPSPHEGSSVSHKDPCPEGFGCQSGVLLGWGATLMGCGLIGRKSGPWGCALGEGLETQRLPLSLPPSCLREAACSYHSFASMLFSPSQAQSKGPSGDRVKPGAKINPSPPVKSTISSVLSS